MTERIVVALHTSLTEPASEPLERLQAVVAAAEARGGELAATFATTIVVSFAPERVAEAVRFLRGVFAGRQEGEVPFRVGMAQGEIVHHADLRAAWGDGFTSALALAERAAAGEVLVAPELDALPSLLTLGTRVARRFGAKITGTRLDLRIPFRTDAEARLPSIRQPAFSSNQYPKALLWPGALSLVRAASGDGGSRLLEELASSVAPAPTLSLEPASVPLEPLGAIRALVGRIPDGAVPAHLVPTVMLLRDGRGAPADDVARCLADLLTPAADAPAGLLLLHDVDRIDVASLEAVVYAVRIAARPFATVALLSPTGELSPALASLLPGPEVVLEALPVEQLVLMLTRACDGELDPKTALRYAKRAAGSPLRAMVDLTLSVASGDVVWIDGVARARRSGAGRHAEESTLDAVRRAWRGLSQGAREVLFVAAWLGPDASVGVVEEVLDRAERSALLRPLMSELVLGRFCEICGENLRVLSGTHARVGRSLDGDDAAEKSLALALAEVVAGGGPLRRASAAVFSEFGGDRPRAIEHASAAVERVRELGYVASTQVLEDFVHRLAPGTATERETSGIRRAEESVAKELPKPPLNGGARAESFSLEAEDNWDDDETAILHGDDFAKTRENPSASAWKAAPAVSEPPPDDGVAGTDFVDDADERTLLRSPAAPISGIVPDPSLVSSSLSPPAREATRRVLLDVKTALLTSDVAALERWLDGDGAKAARPHLVELLRGIVALSKSSVGEALRLLRRARAAAGNESAEIRCQSSLALAMALAAGARHEEALLEALDALARARENGDEGASRACLALLAKLCTSANRIDDANLLRRRAGLA